MKFVFVFAYQLNISKLDKTISLKLFRKKFIEEFLLSYERLNQKISSCEGNMQKFHQNFAEVFFSQALKVITTDKPNKYAI